MEIGRVNIRISAEVGFKLGIRITKWMLIQVFFPLASILSHFNYRQGSSKVGAQYLIEQGSKKSTQIEYDLI